MTKVCNACGIEKDIEMFTKHKRSKLGVTNKCKECRKRDRAIKDSDNRDWINRKQKEWVGRQSEEYKERRKEYRKMIHIKNKEKEREYAIVWKENNKERLLVCYQLNQNGIRMRDIPKELVDIMVANQTLKRLVKNRKEGARHENEQRLLQDS